MSDEPTDDDEPKDTTVEQSDQTPMGQRRQRRRRTAGSRGVSTGTISTTRSEHGILLDTTNQFDGFKLRRLLQDHNSSTRLAQWNNNREEKQQQVHKHQQRPPPIATTTTHAYRRFSNPMSPSSYDPTRSIGLPPLSPVLSSPTGSSSSARSSSSRIAAGPEGAGGVRMLEPSYPKDSLLHKVMAQPHKDDGGGDDHSASQSMPSTKSSPTLPDNDTKGVRVHNVSKSLVHHAEPSSLAAIAELSRRYAPPPSTEFFDALSPMDQNAAMRTPLQHWKYHHSSSANIGSLIGSNVGESVVSSSKEAHHVESNESGHETKNPQEIIASGTQQQNQDYGMVDRLGHSTRSTRSISIGNLVRNIFAREGRARAISQQIKIPTPAEVEKQERSAVATQGAKDIDIVVTTSITPSTVDESEELSVISMSPRLATSRNSGDAQQCQELEEHSDQAAFERGAEFILQLGHLLGKTCTTFLTPHNRKRRPYHQNNGDNDDLSAASSLSSIAPRVIIPSDMIGQRTKKKGPFRCFNFILLLCGCSFMIGPDAILTLGIIAVRRSLSQMSGADNGVMPTDEHNNSKTTQRIWSQKPVLSELQDINSNGTYTDSEMELYLTKMEQRFVGLNDIIRKTADIESSVQGNYEEEKDFDDNAVQNELLDAGFPRNATEDLAQPGNKKDYCEFMSLQKLLKAIYLHKSTKIRAIARTPRTLPTPPRFWQPGKFAVPTNTSVPAEIVGTMSRALVHVPLTADVTPIINIDTSNNAVSTYTSSSDNDFSELYYHTLQYNERTGEDFDIPLSQFLGEILHEYRRAKRKRRIEETQLLAGSDHSVEISTARGKLIRRKKFPLRRLVDWLKHSLPFGL